MPVPAPLRTGRRALGHPEAWFCLLMLSGGDVAGLLAGDIRVTGWAWAAAASALPLGIAALYRTLGRDARIAEMAEWAALWIAFSALGCVLTYLANRPDLPMHDRGMAAIDRALGFDWRAWWDWTRRHPPAAAVLGAVYASLAPQIVLACLVLPLLDGDRAGELFWAAVLSLAVTAALSWLLPANGGFVWYGLPEHAIWLPDLRLLRSGAPAHFVLPAMTGIVSLPSYHAVLAVLFMVAYRRAGVLSRGMAAWNLLMIVATVIEGGHYLADVISGVALGVASVAAVQGVRHALRRAAAERDRTALRRPWITAAPRSWR